MLLECLRQQRVQVLALAHPGPQARRGLTPDTFVYIYIYIYIYIYVYTYVYVSRYGRFSCTSCAFMGVNRSGDYS